MANATNTAANTAPATAPAAQDPSPLLNNPVVGPPAADAATAAPAAQPKAEAVPADKADAADKASGGSDHWYDFLPADWSNWISDNTALATTLFVVALLALFVIAARIWNSRSVTYTDTTHGYSGTEGSPTGFTDGISPYTETAVSEGTDGLSPADEVTPQTTLPTDSTKS